MYSQILHTLGIYGEKELQLFQNAVKLRHVQKNEILLHQGEVAKSVFFSLKGSIYQYVPKPESDYTIIDLHIENEWIINHRSFVAQVPADSFIAAFTEGSVLEITVESIHYLISNSLAFLQLNKILEQSMSRVYFFDNALTPLQKWEFILANKPQLIERFPLKIIASYLKITPETLSRARSKAIS